MNVLSLCDGISCGKVALQRAGIHVDTYYASEVDKNALAISQKNHKDIVQLGDMTHWREWDIPWASIDLVIAGTPCQGFSRNGHCLNFNDKRSKLFFVFADILEFVLSVNPDVKFLLENVIMKKEWRDVISERLGVQPVEINSGSLSGQNRPRQYWTNIGTIELPQDKGVRLLDVLEELPLETIERNGVKFATNIGKGIYAPQMDLVHLVDGEVRISQSTRRGYIVAEPGDGVNIQFPTSKTKRGRVIKGKSPTLDTGCEVCVYTGEVIRQFTLTELERLQTLPDGYTDADGITTTARRKAIGNGWTVDVIAHIFRQMKVAKSEGRPVEDPVALPADDTDEDRLKTMMRELLKQVEAFADYLREVCA